MLRGVDQDVDRLAEREAFVERYEFAFEKLLELCCDDLPPRGRTRSSILSLSTALLPLRIEA
jgi:hypothetical protein